MDCGSGSAAVCWFCRKGRHADCMGTIPRDAKSDGPHDCTFDTSLVPCGCERCTDRTAPPEIPRPPAGRAGLRRD